MLTITQYAFMEKIRKKELFIITIIGVLLLVLIGSGTTNITVNGEPVTDFKYMFPVLHTVIVVLSLSLAVILSSNTIPKEYERHSSHLIWARGISQPVYHGGLTLANILSTAVSAFILYVVLAVYCVRNGHGGWVVKMIPAFGVVLIAVSIVSVFTSACSLFLPSMLSGFLGIAFMLTGVFYPIIRLYKGMIGGIPSALFGAILKVVPNLYGIGEQASALMMGESVEVHQILVGMLVMYVLLAVLVFGRRKEA